MENSKVKAQFFAMYLGQNVLVFANHIPHIYEVQGAHLDNFNTPETHLLLRTVEQLTDEEKDEMRKMLSIAPSIKLELNAKTAEFICRYPNNEYLPTYAHKGYFVYQYLLRIGILLPFTFINEQGNPETYSPEKLIELGWAKIKND